MDATASSAATWFYEETGHRKGPITEEAIIGLMKTGKISYGSLVWKAGYPEWLKVEDTELRTHLEGVSPPPITGKHVNNTIVWILAFAPLIGLFLEACFAFTVNADTGEAVWFYQASPHDLWDHDAINENVLVDLPIDGQMRKVQPEF